MQGIHAASQGHKNCDKTFAKAICDENYIFYWILSTFQSFESQIYVIFMTNIAALDLKAIFVVLLQEMTHNFSE